MRARITIERILRDDDDASGQSIREWAIESEAGFVAVRRRDHGFLLLRIADVDLLIADLQRAKTSAIALVSEDSRS